MARPIKNNADYFPHDKDMRNDPKLRAVRAKFGNEGYAIWCYILESLTNADRFKIEWNELAIELLSGDFMVDGDRLVEVVNYMIRLKLLTSENELLTCENLQRRLEPLIESRERKRAWEEGKKTVNDVGNKVSDVGIPVKDVQSTQSKVKESKVEESKEINKKEKSAMRDFESQNGNAKGEGKEERSEENTPLVAALPPQDESPPSLGDQVMQWAKKNRKSILAKAREVGLLTECENGDQAALEVQHAIEEFCAYHAERTAFQENPILQFQEKYSTWFRIRVEKRVESKKGGKGRKPAQKKEPLICYSPNQCAEFFRSRHGALAENLTQQHKLKLSQCKTNDELSAAMEQVYEILKAAANGNARRGPVDLGSVISQSIPAQS